MIRAFEVSKDEDLSQYAQLLWQRGITNVITEIDGLKVVAVSSPDQVDTSLELYQAWKAGMITPDEKVETTLSSWFSAGGALDGLAGGFRQAPLTLTLVVLCTVIYVLTLPLKFTDLFTALQFPIFARGGVLDLNYVLENMTVTQFVRMFTPILLHGSFLHLVLNMLGLWIGGRVIEPRQQTWVYLLVILLIALIADWAQYFNQGFNNFVGISGVVAGLFGYITAWKLIDPGKGITLPTSILLYMVGVVVVMAFIDLDMIADTAHIAGLLTGALLGIVLAVFSRFGRRTR